MPRIKFPTRMKRIVNHPLYDQLNESVKRRFDLVGDQLSYTSAGTKANVTPERIKQQVTAAWSRLKRLEKKR